MNPIFKFFLFTVSMILLGLVGTYFFFPEATSDLLRKAERSAAGLYQKSLDVEDYRIAYLEGGQGDTIVLLHGFSANKDNWTRVGKYLTPHFRLIAPDLPGFGESSPARDGNYFIDAQIERVKAFIEALGIKSFHLGGSSMGGAIAGAYAARYPKDLKGLLLISPAGVASAEPSDMFRLLKKDQPNPLIVKNAKDFEALLNFVFVKKPFIPAPVKSALIQEAVSLEPLYQDIFEQLVNTAAPGLEDVMNGLPVPTLIIWGDRDRVLHVSGANILGVAIPDATVTVMNGVGHLPMIEKPRETATAYRRFIELKKVSSLSLGR